MSVGKSKKSRSSRPDLLTLALEMIGDAGWAGFSFADLAVRAEIPLAEVRAHFSGRTGLLEALSLRLDEAMLAVDRDELLDLPTRDRIFELIMSRIEAMASFRSGLVRLARDARRDPELVLMTACRLDRSLAWLQDAAGLRSDGLKAHLQRKLLVTIYLRTLSVWSRDDSQDLAKTMASLDKQLRQFEGWAGFGHQAGLAGETVGSA
ncbi:MAG: hypothetical protein ACR2Q4_23830 [Geminicoccaceae bacterium]